MAWLNSTGPLFSMPSPPSASPPPSCWPGFGVARGLIPARRPPDAAMALCSELTPCCSRACMACCSSCRLAASSGLRCCWGWPPVIAGPSGRPLGENIICALCWPGCGVYVPGRRPSAAPSCLLSGRACGMALTVVPIGVVTLMLPPPKPPSPPSPPGPPPTTSMR